MLNLKQSTVALVIGMVLAGAASAGNPGAATLPTIRFDAATPEAVRSFVIDNNGATVLVTEFSKDGRADIVIDIRDASVVTTRKTAVSEVRTLVDLQAAANAAAADPVKAREEVRLFEATYMNPILTSTDFGFQNKASCGAQQNAVASATSTANSACGVSGNPQACANAMRALQTATNNLMRCFTQEN